MHKLQELSTLHSPQLWSSASIEHTQKCDVILFCQSDRSGHVHIQLTVAVQVIMVQRIVYKELFLQAIVRLSEDWTCELMEIAAAEKLIRMSRAQILLSPSWRKTAKNGTHSLGDGINTSASERWSTRPRGTCVCLSRDQGGPMCNGIQLDWNLWMTVSWSETYGQGQAAGAHIGMMNMLG